MRKGNQEQICVKLDLSALSQMEMEHAASGMARNRIINRAIIAYCQAIDIARGMNSGLYKESQVAGWFVKVLAPWLLTSIIVVNDNKNIEEFK